MEDDVTLVCSLDDGQATRFAFVVNTVGVWCASHINLSEPQDPTLYCRPKRGTRKEVRKRAGKLLDRPEDGHP